MKPFVFLRNTTFAALLFFSAAVAAQSSVHTEQVAKAEPALSVAKAPVTTRAADDEIVLGGLKLRNEKMYQHFTGFFKNATSIAIFPEAKTTLIYCMADGVRNNIMYTNKGKLVHTIRYYEPHLLPASISRFVEEDFPGYKMMHVVEVNTEGQTAHLISMENNKKVITVRVLKESCDVYQEYNKQQ